MIENPACGETPIVSVTVTKKVYVAAVVGVPEMLPVAASRLRPGGRAPLVITQVQGQISGAATKVAEYVAPTWPSGNMLGRIVGCAWTGLVKSRIVLKGTSRQISMRRDA